VRVAQDDACAHADQLVHKEEPRLEQLLEYEQQAFALVATTMAMDMRSAGNAATVRLRASARGRPIGTDAALLIASTMSFAPSSRGRTPRRSNASKVGPQVVAPDAVDRYRAAVTAASPMNEPISM